MRLERGPGDDVPLTPDRRPADDVVRIRVIDSHEF